MLRSARSSACGNATERVMKMGTMEVRLPCCGAQMVVEDESRDEEARVYEL